MVYGQNWVLFSDKPPLSGIAGRKVPNMDFNVIVVEKVSGRYFIETAKCATENYYAGANYYAWKFIDPCNI